jgi:iron complex outermembrane receptor protein
MHIMRLTLSLGVSALALITAPAIAQDVGAQNGEQDYAGQDPAPISNTPISEAESSDTTADAGQSGIRDIVVTAQRRAENLQDVPISVAAIGGEQIEALHAVTLQGLQGSVPNVQIGNFSNTPQSAVFTIRGIGVVEPDPYAGNTVGIVVDGVPQYFNTGALIDLYDIDRIEVLRGPQGTLFGANTTGGVVNIANVQPKMDQFGGKVDLSYGNYDHIQAAGALNVPLAENLAARFVISHDRRDGWVRDHLDGDTLGDRNTTLFRGIVRYEPTDNIDVSFAGEYVRSRNGAPVVVNGAVPGEAEYVPTGFLNKYPSPCFPASQRCDAPDRFRSGFNHEGAPIVDATGKPTGQFLDPIEDKSNMNNYRGTLTISINDTGIGDITSITGYRQFRLREDTDQDGTRVFLIDTQRRIKGWQFYQEVRTSVDVTDRLNLLVGGSWMKTHYDLYQHLRINFAGGVTYDPDGTVTYGLPGLFQDNDQNQDNQSFSAFAHSFFDLTDKLRLQAGIRYTHEKTSMLASNLTTVCPIANGGASTFEGTCADGTPNTFISLAAPPEGKETWNNVGWKVGADYRPNDDTMLYAYYARGFKSGGFVGRIGIAEDIGPYSPEKVDTIEAGLKVDFFDRRLRTNFSAFYTNYRDMQIARIYFIGPLQGNTIENAGKSEIKGFEAEVTAVPIEGLTLNGSLAYLSAKYKDFIFTDPATITPAGFPDFPAAGAFPGTAPTGIPRQLEGNVLQNAPKWTSSVSASYELPVGEMGLRLFAQYNYTSWKLLSSIQEENFFPPLIGVGGVSRRAQIKPTHVVNANVDLKVNEQFTLGVWGTNIFDKRYMNSVLDLPGTFALVNYAPPRQYGVSGKFTF